MTQSIKTPIKANINKPQQTVKTNILPRRKPSRETEIGAIWVKEPRDENGNIDPDREIYMTGDVVVNGVKVSFLALRNNFKDTEKKPDWRLHSKELLNAPTTTTETNKVPATNQNTELVEQNPAFLS